MDVLGPLPIDPLLPDVVARLGEGKNLVLGAEPGAGKTTRVPRALLEGGLLTHGECWVLEPRRLAARLAAIRVAEELGEEVGKQVGYAVRFEQKVSAATRIRFVTEGLLLRRLQEDPSLKGIAVVILDEFHERHLHTDLAITLLRRLQKERRPDLRILAMSATLDACPVATYLDADSLWSPGRLHPVEIRYLAQPDDRPLATRVADQLERLGSERSGGHTLVFLPGAAEIRQCLGACTPLAARHGLQLLPLHGSLSLEAQKAAVAPSSVPKVIFSTNVAESSLTLEGVTTVLDSGLGRESLHSTWSGLSGLRTLRISQARCIQRAGRAGRLGPGLCIRLFTEADFRARPAFDLPELVRADLLEASLQLRTLGVEDPAHLDWFEAPPEAALEAAESLLAQLGAVDAHGRVTACGRRMAALPLHPRLARLVVAGEELGIPGLACLGAALLDVGDLASRSGLERGGEATGHGLASDLWPRLDAFEEVERAGFSPGACRAGGLDVGAVHHVRQILRSLGVRRPASEPSDGEERLLKALLLAYPDRVGKAGGAGTFSLAGGGGARLAPGSRVRREALIVALEAGEEARGSGRETLIRVASRIDPEWLLEYFPEAIEDREELVFHEASGRVEQCAGLWYRGLCIDESRRTAEPSPEAGELLAQAVLVRGLGSAQASMERLLDRVAFLGKGRPDLGIPDRKELGQALVRAACQGCVRLRELDAVDWGWALRELLGGETARLLDGWAPEHVQLPKRRVKVEYGGEAPWIASRLQDFLGMKEGPRVGGGSVPLVLHLLAPNQRAVQVTTDLAGFWDRAYQELRPQLSRRYPRHLWPEKP